MGRAPSPAWADAGPSVDFSPYTRHVTEVRIGALCWNQYTDWPSLLQAGVRADRLGYTSLWTWDHLYPIVGNDDGPMFEAWLTLAAWAQATERVRIGLMVGANTFREPALTAKMATTLDHISGGRAILGIGGAWFEAEHEAFGLPFGDGFPERLRWLGEALPVMRGMLHGERPTAAGPRYHATAVRNDPPPIQERLPILIGGGGEQVTLKLVARYGDANNVGGGLANVKRKDAILVQHCETVGRDPAEIERTTGLGTVIIRDSRAEAERVQREIFARNGKARLWTDQPVGTPEDVAAIIAPFLEIGYRHLIAGFPSPYDEESMTRLATEVRPLLGSA
jgi:alkanesulfonate monooxygenase SsuD/methylene tetrahydromethanopterin reductase-like flavin-dependent oxidoreductase (luciferase family)